MQRRVAAEVVMWADLEATSAVSMEWMFEVG
jgi:hypothetical protein